MRVAFWFGIVLFITGCSCERSSIDHRESLVDFDDRITFNWESGHPKTWGFAAGGRIDEQFRMRYALYLYDGENKRFLMGSGDTAVALPVEEDGFSNENFAGEVVKGGWQMWLDYEVYDEEENLLRKGSALSVPSPRVIEAK